MKANHKSIRYFFIIVLDVPSLAFYAKGCTTHLPLKVVGYPFPRYLAKYPCAILFISTAISSAFKEMKIINAMMSKLDGDSLASLIFAHCTVLQIRPATDVCLEDIIRKSYSCRTLLL